MPDYNDAKIYKLWSPSTNLIYIGSTTQTIAQRLAEHIAVYKCFKNGKGNFITSFKVLECEDYKIELLELYPCNNRTQLHKKEGEYIKSLECVNKKIEGRTKKEYEEDNKEKIKEYNKNNKKRNKYLKEYNKKKYETNKEIVLQDMKNYYQTNKEIIKQKTRQYREKNKEKIEKENLQLTLKITELTNKIDELKKENKQLKEEYIKANNLI